MNLSDQRNILLKTACKDNKIQKIDPSLFKGLINIREIWLESNTIISIDKSAFVDLNNLELICLGDNPITFIVPTL